MNRIAKLMFAKATATGYPLRDRRKFRGLEISIEHKEGDVRSGTSPAGKKWETKMRVPYGYIRGTESSLDGDHIDCFVGPDENAPDVYVIRQVEPETGKFDEEKCMLGFDSAHQAKSTYLAHYDSDKFFGSMIAVPFEEFKAKALATLAGGGGLVGGEACAHCGAEHERGDDGKCNQCRRPWPEMVKSQLDLFAPVAASEKAPTQTVSRPRDYHAPAAQYHLPLEPVKMTREQWDRHPVEYKNFSMHDGTPQVLANHNGATVLRTAHVQGMEPGSRTHASQDEYKHADKNSRKVVDGARHVLRWGSEDGPSWVPVLSSRLSKGLSDGRSFNFQGEEYKMNPTHDGIEVTKGGKIFSKYYPDTGKHDRDKVWPSPSFKNYFTSHVEKMATELPKPVAGQPNVVQKDFTLRHGHERGEPTVACNSCGAQFTRRYAEKHGGSFMHRECGC